MKSHWAAAFGIVGGLLGAGIILLVSRAPRGPAIQLTPRPTASPIIVHVTGAVIAPGVYSLPTGSRVQDAITAASGLLPEADTQALNLAAPLQDGLRLLVPSRNTATTAPLPLEVTPAEPSGLININTASQLELESLPGIGPALAERIIAFRNANGAFQAIEGLLEVKGIGPATLERFKDRITVQDTP